MVKFGVIVLCILASARWTNSEGFLDKLNNKAYNYVDRAATGVECQLGNDDACVKSFIQEHQTEILVGVGVLAALMIICCICCCCCRRTKPGAVYLQAPMAQNYQRV